ncbi:porin family protein [Shewanella cyperi]|uniref:porin family protein n=1 Tax=Shewanella cyperi TaxID=2814292 RepID=UPI001A951C6C|nr:porin family protein [Shewanella cyperi]QSX40689.1 porin family protein [Shewanella cyperi]
MKLNSLLVGSLLLSLTSPVFAAKDLGYYLGGQINHTSMTDRIGDFEESALGLGVYGGYNFNKSFGLEAGIHGTDSYIDEVDIRSAAITLAPTVRHAYSDVVTVYLKGGLLWEAIYSPDDSTTDDYRGIGWLLGTGVDMTLTESLALRLSYEYSETEPESKDYDNYFASTRVHQFGVGMHYRF